MSLKHFENQNEVTTKLSTTRGSSIRRSPVDHVQSHTNNSVTVNLYQRSQPCR